VTRHVPAEFTEKVASVDAALASERQGPRRVFHMSEEVHPGVRLVVTQAADHPVVFSLWTDERDVAELCGDAAYPATAGLLAIDKPQVAELGRAGVVVDLASLVRSESVPGVYYTLLDHLSVEAVRGVVRRLVPSSRGAAEEPFR